MNHKSSSKYGSGSGLGGGYVGILEYGVSTQALIVWQGDRIQLG